MRKSAMRSVDRVQDEFECDIKAAYHRTVQVWMLHILLHLRGYRQISRTLAIDEEDIVAALELKTEPGEIAEDAVNEFTLKRRLLNLKGSAEPKRCALTRNIDWLSNVLEFTPVDRAILEFLLMLRLDPVLSATTHLIGDSLVLGDVANALARILELPMVEVKASLDASGALRRSGLIRLERRAAQLDSKVFVLAPLIDVMTPAHADPMDILSAFVDSAPPPLLAPADFDDYREDYDLLGRHLRKAAAARRAGCNVLIHGAPGVGKTQLVRTLVRDLGMKLFEVTSEDNDGEPLSTNSRLGALQLTQNFMGRSRDAVILFDEVEDAFAADDMAWLFGGDDTSARKSWLNEVLEQNRAPVFWIANRVGGIDPAHLRRFDYVFEMRPMSTSARERLLKAACKKKGLAAGAWIKQAAQSVHISPALIDKITSVVASVRAGNDDAVIFERVANGTLKAMGHPPIRLLEKRPLIPYSVDLINADLELPGLVAGLRRVKAGRILCYGPPGTGKTAFARHLASELGMPLLEFRASDILGPYVGMTEHNIAEAFRRATEEGAVMLLDEIDSLLRSREGADRSWEVTQVNELLVQMEEFPGILIACTNFRDGLDGAAARRFDRKIRFGYLVGDKAWALFKDTLRHHGVRLGRGKAVLKRRVRALQRLTPGDFQSAVRGASLTEEGVMPECLAAALEAENLVKESTATRSIGFRAAI